VSEIAVFGAGKVAAPAIRLLLGRGHRVRVLTDRPEDAPPIAAPFLGRIDARDDGAVRAAISRADLALSLLPAHLHGGIARGCIEGRRPFLSTSYVSPEIQALDAQARQRGVLLFNECGLDPGIDHVLAMDLIQRARERGARVLGFRSLCGGIPAESNANPLGYKISWSTRGVALAGTRAARYLEDGSMQECAAGEIFQHPDRCEIEGAGVLELYPNGDSLPYLKKYAIEEARSIFRGTLRWPGWCETWDCIARLGWLDDKAMAKPQTRSQAAALLGLDPSHGILERLEWLGLFDEAMDGTRSRLDHLVSLMDQRMPYEPGEEDLVLLQDEIEIVNESGAAEKMTATILEKGIACEESAMSRLVGVPAALAAIRILDGTISGSGVRIPDDPETARILLADLSHEGIHARNEARVP
jgi:saccharopine dehydrogenase-like NADP-dependent oxidoreductase